MKKYDIYLLDYVIILIGIPALLGRGHKSMFDSVLNGERRRESPLDDNSSQGG